ncbi:hypothetical protein ACWEPL_32770 [Nonomuraea sp. NPDC004186]
MSAGSRGGASRAQTSCAFRQRVRNRHPDGGSSGEGPDRAEKIVAALLRARERIVR